MLVITRIPTHRNSGSKIGRRELRGILNRVCNAFGGYTLEGPFHGAWVADDGQRYEETSFRLEVVVPSGDVKAARELFVSIGSQLG